MSLRAEEKFMILLSLFLYTSLNMYRFNTHITNNDYSVSAF